LQEFQPACWSFAYEPSDDPLVVEIIEQIRLNNNLDKSDIIGFRSEAEVHRHLLQKPNATLGAYHVRVNYGCDTNVFAPASLSDECNSVKNRSFSEVLGIRYAVQYNSSTIRWRGNTLDTKPYVQLPMISQFDRAVFELIGSDSVNVSQYNVDIRRYPKPQVLTFTAVSASSPFLFFAALMFNFVIQVGAVVQEKELKLRESMRVMGLLDSSYWLSWSLVNVLMAVIASLLLCAAGAAFQFKFFLTNDFLTYFILFILFGVSMIPLSFVVSTLLDTSATATTLGFVIFLVGSLVQFFSPTIYLEDGPLPAKILLSFFPFIIFGKGLTDLADATSSDAASGIRFSEITSHTASWPLSQIYYWLAIDIGVYTVLYILLDNVLYMNRPIYFFLTPSYWRGPSKKKNKLENPSGLTPSDFGDVDVSSEFASIQAGTINASNRAVIIRDLQKTYTKTKFGCIPDPKTTFKAVRGVSLGIEQGTLLCLLGHNGAGKTTTIGMLTGLFPSSGGDAFIFGNSIVDEMEEIRSVMGVCPQHDILWDNLTAREHLELFARLKNLDGDIEAEIEARLRDVSLLGVADVPAGNYSGGMKRRLSVAVALIGDPKIVFLDEPTYVSCAPNLR
jgi:ABC-type Na+ transport system ATPase subunit NatA